MLTLACGECDTAIAGENSELHMTKCMACGEFGIGGYYCGWCEHAEDIEPPLGHDHFADAERTTAP